MCGRFTFVFQFDDFIRQFGLLRDTPAFKTSYNIGPDAEIPVILRSRKTDQIECHTLRWGFPGIEPGRLMNNARSETVHQKASFRDSFAARRCIIPASGFYEWNEETRRPYYVSPENGYFGFAGLWTAVRDPAGTAPPVLRCIILTQAADHPYTAAHHRFPVVIPHAAYGTWLGPETPTAVLQTLVTSPPPVGTRIWPVCNNVNRMANNDESLISPIDHDANSALQAPIKRLV